MASATIQSFGKLSGCFLERTAQLCRDKVSSNNVFEVGGEILIDPLALHIANYTSRLHTFSDVLTFVRILTSENPRIRIVA